MIPNDLRRSNLRVDQILSVGESINAPLVEAKDIIVRRNITIAEGAKITFETQLGDTLVGDDLRLQANAKQIVVGSPNNNTVTFNIDTTTPTIITFPNPGIDSQVVLTEGAQTINGLKTFTGGVALSSMNLLDTSNQINLGTGTLITLNAPTPSDNRTYTFPDVGANAQFVMTQGNQVIHGTKTFTSPPIIPGLSVPFIFLTDTIDQIILGTGNTVTLTSPAPATDRTYAIPDVGANASFVMTEGAQTITGTKTFTAAPIFPPLTFASLTLTDASNQLVLGMGNTVTLTAPTPASSRTYTIPDSGGAAAFVMTQGAQTISGTKTFVTAPVFPPLSFASLTLTNVSNQLTFGSGTTTTITTPTPVGSRTYTVPDAGLNAAFVMTEGNQSIAATKTFSGDIRLATLGGTAADLNYYSETTQTPFLLTSSVFTVSPQSTTVRYVRIGRLVCMVFTGFTVAAAGAGPQAISSVTLVPTEYLPSITVVELTTVTNSSSLTVGTVEVNVSGILTFFRASAITNTQATFQTGGTAGISSFSKAWTLN